MKYSTGEEIELLDKVEYQQGGIWVSATVVFIEEGQEAAEEYNWLLEEKPEWTKGTIAIKWDDYDSVKSEFLAYEKAAEGADASILFTDASENDELRFLSRNS